MRKPRRRGNGEGSVLRVSGKRRLPFAAVLVVGWTPEGRPIRRSRFAESEKVAKALLGEMRAAHGTGRPLPSERMTVGRWLVEWLEHVKPTVRPSTWANYDGVVRRYLLPELGTIVLRTLTPSRVETMLHQLAERGLSPYSLAASRDVLKTALRAAEREGLVERNVASLSRPPRLPRQQKEAPSPAEIRSLLAALEDHRLRDMVLVMAATGLRVSEAMGLTWDDVGPGLLTVRWQLARIEGEPVLAPPKSERSRRTISLAPVAVAALRRVRAMQAAERLAVGTGWQDATGLVFTTADGRPLAESTVQWVMARACRDADIRHVSPHDLRRFAATAVAATGDMKAAQTMLGHTAAGLTADVYASATEASMRRAAAAMEEALG